MPDHLEYQPGKFAVRLTNDEEALVRGMNGAAFSNIAALHFDGQVLAEMVYAHRKIANAERVR